jgi:putative glutamine amidotransferase
MTPRAPLVLVSSTHHNDDYVASVVKAGGDARLADASEPIPPALWQQVAGVVLTGGADVDPRLYGEEPHPTCQIAAAARDAFEIEIVARAVERDVPLLGICRGIQVMNVAAGGTLVQDVPSGIPRALEHRVKTPQWAIAHEVAVDPSSQLARALRRAPDAADRVAVNSRHHQAVKHVAPGFATVATAPDGVIEGIERPGARFCIGVQWHPENFWRTGEFDALFAAFLAACRG